MTTTTENIKIDKDRALELLEAAVEERSANYIYEIPKDAGGKCVYQSEGVPSCGVGLALSKAGVSISALAALDHSPSLDAPVSIGTNSARLILAAHGVKLTPQASLVLDAFQGRQDSRSTWGDALSDAKKVSYDH